MVKETKRRLVKDPLDDHMGKQPWWTKVVVKKKSLIYGKKLEAE